MTRLRRVCLDNGLPVISVVQVLSLSAAAADAPPRIVLCLANWALLVVVTSQTGAGKEKTSKIKDRPIPDIYTSIE